MMFLTAVFALFTLVSLFMLGIVLRDYLRHESAGPVALCFGFMFAAYAILFGFVAFSG